MTTVALLGGSGRLGQYVINRLVDRGYAVRALVHRSTLQIAPGKVETVGGDVYDPASLAKLLDGAGVVVSTLGSAAAPVPDVCTAAVRNLIPLMAGRGIERLVSTTGSAARLDSEKGHEHRWLAVRREMLIKHMAPMILDAEEHMRLLANSHLIWTVLRLPIMSQGSGDKSILREFPDPPDVRLTYHAVAESLVDELASPCWPRAAPFAVPA